jgi:hypothetical protein
MGLVLGRAAGTGTRRTSWESTGLQQEALGLASARRWDYSAERWD